MVACLQEGEWAACWGQREDVHKEVEVEVPSSSQREAVAA